MTTAVKELDPPAWSAASYLVTPPPSPITSPRSPITPCMLPQIPTPVSTPTRSGSSSSPCVAWGISVDELCALADKREGDTLLFGTCGIDQVQPLSVGHTYRTTASIDSVSRRTTRDGSVLDSLTVTVTLFDTTAPAGPVGAVTSVYLFKRGQN